MRGPLMITSVKTRGSGKHVICSTLVYPNVTLCKSVTSRFGMTHENIYITPVIEHDFFIAFGAGPRRKKRAGELCYGRMSPSMVNLS